MGIDKGITVREVPRLHGTSAKDGTTEPGFGEQSAGP